MCDSHVHENNNSLTLYVKSSVTTHDEVMNSPIVNHYIIGNLMQAVYKNSNRFTIVLPLQEGALQRQIFLLLTLLVYGSYYLVYPLHHWGLCTCEQIKIDSHCIAARESRLPPIKVVGICSRLVYDSLVRTCISTRS